ncbi:MAG: transporter substrate-binding domain-containing protein [Exilispira sp.]|jgi:signal transduction histidine kinase/ABC-type amino acid transport substrate-binding protein/CheY-like chemotaxis protein|nr:transporter substrate-binding domain-containing protein [Exilispira sp.]
MQKNTKKVLIILSIICTLLIISFFLYLTLSKDKFETDLNKKEIESIKNNNTIHFVGQINYAPFEFVDKNGDYNGMMIDLLRWISYEYGFNITFTPANFKEAQQMVLEGKADGISSLFYSEKREQVFDFSLPVFLVPASIFVSSFRYDINNFKDLNGKKIGMQRGDYAQDFLKENNVNCEIVYVDDFYQAIDKIVENEVDAVIGDEQVVWYHIFSMKYLDKVKIIGEPLYIGLNCFGLHKGNNLLLSILNKGIERAKKNGLLDRLTKKWIGVSYKAEEKEKIDIRILAIFLIIIFFVIIVLTTILFQTIKETKLIKETSEQRLRKLIDSIPMIIYLCDQNLNIVEYNKEFIKFFNIVNFENKDRKEIIKNLSYFNIEKYLPTPMFAQFKQLSYDDPNVLQSEKNIRRESEILNIDLKKRVFLIEKIIIKSKYKNIKWVLTLAKDITDEKKAEEEILKVQKLESVGLLAGKIAHDFNNVLTGIIGNLSLAQIYIDDRKELEELLTNAKEVSLQAKSITSQLLSFAKGGDPIKELFDPLEIIRSVINFSLKGTSVDYELKIDSEDRYYIYADKSQFFQALNNLVINAIQANDGNGKITLSTSFKELDNFKEEKIEKKFYCIISVEDEGNGISEDVMTKIFNPFFTTKTNGSGLGLSSVKTITKNHQGYVFFENKNTKGAIFYLLFPCTSEKILPKEKEKLNESNFQNFSILILDDDEVVINTAKKIFQYFSCSIKYAKNAEDFFNILENNKFDICILDLVIPSSIGGEEVIKIAKKRYPFITYIVSSGYSSSPVLANYKDYGFDFVLKKPYDFEDIKILLEKISKKEK